MERLLEVKLAEWTPAGPTLEVTLRIWPE